MLLQKYFQTDYLVVEIKITIMITLPSALQIGSHKMTYPKLKMCILHSTGEYKLVIFVTKYIHKSAKTKIESAPQFYIFFYVDPSFTPLRSSLLQNCWFD